MTIFASGEISNFVRWEQPQIKGKLELGENKLNRQIRISVSGQSKTQIQGRQKGR